MFRWIYRLDETDSIEANLVAEASNRLMVGEFQLFQLAYEAWYGNAPNADLLEPMFFDYLMHNEIPFWARNFARRTIESDDRGELNAQDARYHQFDRDFGADTAQRHGVWRVATVFAVTVLFLAWMVLAEWEPTPEINRCHFPPCSWLE